MANAQTGFQEIYYRRLWRLRLTEHGGYSFILTARNQLNDIKVDNR